MVVMDVFTRRIVGFGVERADIDGVSVCRMFNQAIAGQQLPKHISSDNDPLFRFHRRLANLRVLDVDEIKSVPNVPVSHPFIERPIGTIRHEYLDRVFFCNSVDLTHKLNAFHDYYNTFRVHRSLDGTTPPQRGWCFVTGPYFTWPSRVAAALRWSIPDPHGCLIMNSPPTGCLKGKPQHRCAKCTRGGAESFCRHDVWDSLTAPQRPRIVPCT